MESATRRFSLRSGLAAHGDAGGKGISATVANAGPGSRAAVLLGAIDAARAAIEFGVVVHPLHVARVIDRVRDALPPNEFDQAWLEGHALEPAQAIEDALLVAVENASAKG